MTGHSTSDGEHPRLRVLVLAPFAPRLDALHGGGRVVATLLERLADRHRIALVHLREEDEQPLDEATRASCEIVEEIVAAQPTTSRLRLRLARLRKLVGAPPDRVVKACVPGFAARMLEVVETWRPDIIHMECVEIAQYVSDLDHARALAPRVLVDHDPGASAAADFSSTASGPRRQMRRLDVLAWRRFSRKVFARADCVVVFTERDRAAVQPLLGRTPAAVIPFALDLSMEPLDPRGADPPTVLFFGGYLHPPNSDAAVRLIRGIMPCVRRHHPNAVLELVGTHPTEEMISSACEADVITGRVSSLTPHLNGAAVVVAPLRLGGGMRVKVLETLAAGKALVASSRAVEGFDVRDGHELLIADTDEEFCAAISELLADEDRRVEVARAARAWAEGQADAHRMASAFDSLYRELLSARE